MADIKFPKKQEQRLIPKYLLEYATELNEKHPDPSEDWGKAYTAGTGINVSDDYVISIDNTDVPLKSDLSTVAFSGDYDDLTNKPVIPDISNMVTTDTAQTITGKKTMNQIYIPYTGTNQRYIQLGAKGAITSGTTSVTPQYRTNKGTATTPTWSSYGAEFPDTSSYTANKIIATTDQIINVEANPAGTPSATLTQIGIGDTLYALGGGDVTAVKANGTVYEPDQNGLVNLGYVTPEGSTLTSGTIYRHRIYLNDSSNYVIGEYLTTDNTPFFTGGQYSGVDLISYFPAIQQCIDASAGSEYFLGSTFVYNNKTYRDITNALLTDVSRIYKYLWGNTYYMEFPKPTSISLTKATVSSTSVVTNATVSNFTELQFYNNTTLRYTLTDAVDVYCEVGLVEPADTVKSIEVNGTTYTPTNNVVTLPNYPTLPTLATVATSGDYDDLLNKPTIPTVPITEIQVNNITVTPVSGVVDITVPTLPTLATVATTGDYDDLTDKPDLSIYAQSANLATVATSGDYTDLINKPNIPKGLIELYLSASTDEQTGTLTQEQAEALLLNPYNYYIVDNLLSSKYYQLVSYLQQTVMTNTLHTLTFINQNTNNYYTISIQINAGQSEYARRQWTFHTGTPYITGINSSDVTTALGYTPGTSNFSGDYTDLTNKPTIPDEVIANVTVPSGASDLTSLQIGSTVYNIPSGGGSGAVNDVQVDGTSVVDADGVANITLPVLPTLQSGTITVNTDSCSSSANLSAYKYGRIAIVSFNVNVKANKVNLVTLPWAPVRKWTFSGAATNTNYGKRMYIGTNGVVTLEDSAGSSGWLDASVAYITAS